MKSTRITQNKKNLGGAVNSRASNFDVLASQTKVTDDTLRDLRSLYEMILDVEDFGLSEQIDLEELFGAMKTVDDVKAILIGQDSYANPEKVTSMAFSYRRGQAPTGSVKEIILAALKGREEHDETFIDDVEDGYLGSWRDQGLLMINSDSPGAAELVKGIVRETAGRVCGILLGNEAQKLCGLFTTAFAWNHPSRRSTINNDPSDIRHWNHTDVFWKANEYIFSIGRLPINWATVAGRKTLWCFTDGAYSSTKKEGASSFVIYGGLKNLVCESFKKSKAIKTNNIGEFTAILDVLKYATQYTVGNVVILSDSRNCVMTIMEWYHNWVKKNTLDSHANIELITKIMNIIEKSDVKIKLQHVYGHKDEPADTSSKEHFFWMGNDHADKLINYATK